LFSKARLGDCLAFLLLLPLPVVAYTITPWSFTPGTDFTLADSAADHKPLTYSGASGSGSQSDTGSPTVTGSAGETLRAHLDLTGLTIHSGSLTVSITVGSTTVSQTFNASNPVFDFGPIALAAGSQGIQVNFSFSSGVLWNYTSSGINSLAFR
jgi:hypothetical protein